MPKCGRRLKCSLFPQTSFMEYSYEQNMTIYMLYEIQCNINNASLRPSPLNAQRKIHQRLQTNASFATTGVSKYARTNNLSCVIFTVALLTFEWQVYSYLKTRMRGIFFFSITSRGALMIRACLSLLCIVPS